MAREILTGARMFDGQLPDRRPCAGHRNGEIADPAARTRCPAEGRREVPGIIAPGFLDLQVNGGGGLMVDGATDLAALRHICATHRGLARRASCPR
jgi:N-acetylglucosamine-6-phosphate deacetylase